MAAGLGFKTFTTGEVLTAADTNGYLMQGINVFASSAARAAAITSPQEGQYSYLKDTNALEYYDGAAWVGAPVGDITGVTAGVGISGGGTSGTVTVTNSMATEIAAKGDLIAGTGSQTFDNLTVGANATVLTADSTTATGLKWAAAATSSANFSLIASASLSGSTTTISSISGMNQLYVLIKDASVTGGGALLRLRINTDTAGNYDEFRGQVVGNTSWDPSNVGGACNLGNSNILIGLTSNMAASLFSGGAMINGCNTAGKKMIMYSGGNTAAAGNGQYMITGLGNYNGTSTVSSVSLNTDSTFDAGTMYVYGSA
jgi:hypothetical protein